MSGEMLYANANIMMQSDTHLLTRKRIREMATAPDRAAALKILAECNYQTDFDDDETIIETERAKTNQTFLELCDDPALKACVRAWSQADENNFVESFTIIAAALPRLKSASIRAYFQLLADFTNVRTFYKGGKTWVSGGELQAGQFNIFPELTTEERENAMRARLQELAAVEQDNIFAPNPLFWWYHQKQNELVVVKTLLQAKRLGYDTALIRASLKGFYEQFK